MRDVVRLLIFIPHYLYESCGIKLRQMFSIRFLLILCALTPTSSVQVMCLAIQFQKEGSEQQFNNLWYGTDRYGVEAYFSAASHTVS